MARAPIAFRSAPSALFALSLAASCLGPRAATAESAPTPPAPAPAPAVTSPPTASGGYAFTVNRPVVYVYDLTQTVNWESAGDKLTYTTTLAWSFTLRATAVAAERVDLEAVILAVQASQVGPGGPSAAHRVDSRAEADQDGGDDALLGHLLALKGAVLTLVMDPRTGRVAEVKGGDGIVERINRRAPAAFPGEAPPLAAQAMALYSSEALARQWSEMFALPGDGGVQPITLGPPLAGTVERRWNGTSYALALPTGTDHLDAQLVKDPNPVSASLGKLVGSGKATLVGGLLGEATGDLAFTLTLSALTQPVVQNHHLAWRLRLLPAAAPPR
jgi:hypothetical protein